MRVAEFPVIPVRCPGTMKIDAAIIGLVVLAWLLPGAAPGLAEGGNGMISIGQPFVDFDLEAHDGTRVSNSDLEGRPYLLFFYPKASTPG